MRYVRGLLKPMYHGLLDLLLPLHCLFCHRLVPSRQRSVPLCSDHLASLKPLPRPGCHTCGRPLRPSEVNIPPAAGAKPMTPPVEENPLCGSCRTKPVPLSVCLTGFAYRGTLRQLVRDWKFGGFEPWGPFLGSLLARRVGGRVHPDRWDYLIPVPLHPKRRRRRGFNQSAQLTDVLQRDLQIPRLDGLIKQRRTRPQSQLNRRQRLENVKGAFRVRDPSRLRDRSILVVDDVFTTGTTVNEAARTLQEVEVRRVGAVVLARALPGETRLKVES